MTHPPAGPSPDSPPPGPKWLMAPIDNPIPRPTTPPPPKPKAASHEGNLS